MVVNMFRSDVLNKMKKNIVILTLALILISYNLSLYSASSVSWKKNIKENVAEPFYKPSFNREWEKTYGKIDKIDYGLSVDTTSDGGYVLTGLTVSYGTNGDVWLIKTDSYGNEVWNKTYGGEREDRGLCVQQTRDNGYIISGYTYSYGKGGDLWVVKTDYYGNILWNKSFGGRGYEEGASVLETNDGGYILVGETQSYGHGNSDVWLIKLDEQGNLVWDKTFGGSDIDIGYSIDITSDGGYIIVGDTFSYGSDESDDIWLIKTDSEGNELWNHTYGGVGVDIGWCVQETRDGGFIIVGEFDAFGCDDIWLIKTDSNGNMLWNRTFGGGGFDWARYVEETSDGGYIVVGGTSSYSRYGGNDLWLIKTDKDGNKEWGRILGGEDDDEGYCVHQTSDGGYIIAGYRDLNFYEQRSEAWLIKVIPDNKPPGKPLISGPTSGRIKNPYEYGIISIDPEGDDIYYFILWGDSISPWVGPFKSGENATVSHTWYSEGNYYIWVKAMDEYGWEGPWSDPLPVTMPKPFWLDLLPPLLQRILS